MAIIPKQKFAAKIWPKPILLALLNLGFISFLGQITIIRELINSLWDNELFIGIIFAYWLISVGLGSLWWAEKLKQKIKINLSAAHLVLPLFFFFSVILAHSIKIIAPNNQGAVPNLSSILIWSGLAIIPLGLSLGALFPWLANSLKRKKTNLQPELTVALAYSLESFGFLIGALFFYFFAYQLSSLMVSWLAGGLCLLLALAFSGIKTNKILKIVTILLFLAGGYFIPSLNIKLLEQQYQQKISDFANTKFGTVVVTQQQTDSYFYYNGRLTAAANDKFHQELTAHLPLLLAPKQKNILLIGNITAGLIRELTKYKPQNLTLVEMDKKYFLLTTKNKLSGLPFEQIIFADPRQFISQTKQSFDAIIINYSNPNTLAANRYFTQEFFKQIKKILQPQGIVALIVNTTPNYNLGAQNKLLAIYYHTLKKVFPWLLVLPDNEVVFLASSQPLNTNISTIKKHYQNFNLNNYYLTPQLIEWRLTNDRGQILKYNLAQSQQTINTDQQPQLYWQQINSFLEKIKAKKLLKTIAWLAVVSIIILFLCSYYRPNFKWLIFSASPEALLLSLEIMLIFWFAAKKGWLYTQLSLIVSLILFGLSSGSLINCFILKTKQVKKLLPLTYALIFLAFFLPWVLVKYFSFIFNFNLSFYLLALMAGAAVGGKFPILNKIYLKNNYQIGAIYGADLIGASLGALFAGNVLLPFLGIENSLAVLALLAGACWLAGFKLAKE